MTSRTCRRTWRKLLRDRHDVPPSLFFSIREAYQGYAEFITSAPVSVLTKKEHSGDGRPVLVIPGFTGSDLYNYPLISFLRRKGYHAKGLYQLVKPSGASDTEGEWSKPPHVPCVAIYSVCDGVVNWRVTRQKGGDVSCRNFEVRGSHVGLTNNKNVWRIIYNCLQ